MTGKELQQYVERILVEHEKATQLVAKNLEDRLHNLNQLREEWSQKDKLFVSQTTYEFGHRILSDKVEKLDKFQSKMIGIGLTVALLSGILGAIVSHIVFK